MIDLRSHVVLFHQQGLEIHQDSSTSSGESKHHQESLSILMMIFLISSKEETWKKQSTKVHHRLFEASEERVLASRKTLLPSKTVLTFLSIHKLRLNPVPSDF